MQRKLLITSGQIPWRESEFQSGFKGVIGYGEMASRKANWEVKKSD